MIISIFNHLTLGKTPDIRVKAAVFRLNLQEHMTVGDHRVKLAAIANQPRITHQDVYKRQAYMQSQSYEKALRMGVACGSATAFNDDLAKLKQIMSYYEGLNIRSLNADESRLAEIVE